MCTFITAVLPASADADAVAAIFRAHGRVCVARPADAGESRALATGERLFHTTPTHCDCGTPLGRSTWGSGRDKSADMAARLRRKGWSEAKIARAVMQRAEADARPPRPRGEPAPTSLAEWVALIDAVLASRATPSLGLYWENTPGADDDSVSSTPRVRIPRSSLDDAVLAGMAEGVIHAFER